MVSQCFKFHTKSILTLETKMQNLFEANVNQNADALPRTVKDDFVFTGAWAFVLQYKQLMYEQFQLDHIFKTHVERTMQSKHVLRKTIEPIPYQKSFEIVTGTESRAWDFRGANKHFLFSLSHWCTIRPTIIKKSMTITILS